jgi:hypothetical protein
VKKTILSRVGSLELYAFQVPYHQTPSVALEATDPSRLLIVPDPPGIGTKSGRGKYIVGHSSVLSRTTHHAPIEYFVPLVEPRPMAVAIGTRPTISDVDAS